jgi:hypothetical protein
LPAQYAFNLFSHTTKIGENGYNEEEMKMVKETRKIWGVRAPRLSQPLCFAARLAHGARLRLALLGCIGFGARRASGARMMIIFTITDLN